MAQTKLVITLFGTAVEQFASRKITDASVQEAAAKAIAGADQYGYGTASQPTIFNVDGEKVKVYTNKDGSVINVGFTGTYSEKPKNAPIDL